MAPSILIGALIALLVGPRPAFAFKVNQYSPGFYGARLQTPATRLRPPCVYRDSRVGAMWFNPPDLKAIPDHLRYETLTDFLPDRARMVQSFRRAASRYRNLAARAVQKLRLSSLSSLGRCFYDLVEELKFWYLKGSNFSFYDLFTLGDNPVYMLVKANLLVFVLDFFLKGELYRSFAVRGLDLFFKNEHYRILTSLFLHSDLRHLLSNLGSLLSIGNNVLKVFGPRNLVLIYFVAGLTANYVSYLYNYAYKNGIPANLLLLLRSIGRNFSNATKPIVTATNTIVDDILQKSRRVVFPVFMCDYLVTSAAMALDAALARVAQLFGGVAPRAPNEVDRKVREICMTKSRSDFASCGSSSSIFGLYGALLAHYVRSGYINNYAVINNMFVSFLVPYILRSFTDRLDHVSHLVGFLTGAALSAALD